MTTTEQRQLARERIEETVLDAVQKGFTRVSDLISYCGPQLIEVNTAETERELDVPQVMRAIERMIRRGHLDREGSRTLDQLTIRLTDQGQEAAPAMSERERELVDRYGVHPRSLSVLFHIVEYEREHDSLPSMSQLQQETPIDLVAYQMQPLFMQLIRAGLADERGFFRFRVDPTDEGRTAVEEFADLVTTAD